MKNTIDNIRLSTHFMLSKFLNLKKYPDNVPDTQQLLCLHYGCLMLLEPARQEVGPIIINSGFRNDDVNRKVGGVKNSQHLLGQAADIRPRDPTKFQQLVEFLKHHPQTDQLLTGSGWLHISWSPLTPPRHFTRLGYYK